MVSLAFIVVGYNLRGETEETDAEAIDSMETKDSESIICP